MKNLLLFACVCIISLTCSSQDSTIKKNDSPYWEYLRKKAQREKKNIFLNIGASWCSVCKRMDKEVFSNIKISHYIANNFIIENLQIDSSSTDDEEIRKKYPFTQYIKKEFRITSLPTFLFLDSNGNLLHQEEGFATADSLLSIMQTANDSTRNQASLLYKFQNGKLKSLELLNYALKLKQLKNDSLSLLIAQKYKETELDNQKTDQALTPTNFPFFSKFLSIFNLEDPIIRYIYFNHSSVDKSMKLDGFSENIITELTQEKIVTPILKDNQKNNIKTPSWALIEKKILKYWNQKTTNQIILDTKIQWYNDNKLWDSTIKYQLEKFDQNGPISDSWQGMIVNNFIYEVVFKRSSDPIMLKKACNYMKSLTNTFPTDYAKTDTYANILYKLGHKEKAIEVETEALLQAEKKGDHETIKIFNETIEKMRKNIPTWD